MGTAYTITATSCISLGVWPATFQWWVTGPERGPAKSESCGTVFYGCSTPMGMARLTGRREEITRFLSEGLRAMCQWWATGPETALARLECSATDSFGFW